jgi:hypothetical protein
MLQLPDEVAFVKKTTPEGWEYWEHRLVDKLAEAEGSRLFAALLAKNGYKDIRLLPQIDAKEQVLRKRYYGENYASYAKRPDASINGIVVEFKSSNSDNISSNIGVAAKQANIAIISIRPGNIVSEIHIKDVASRQWAMDSRKNLREVIIIHNGKVYSFKRP